MSRKTISQIPLMHNATHCGQLLWHRFLHIFCLNTLTAPQRSWVWADSFTIEHIEPREQCWLLSPGGRTEIRASFHGSHRPYERQMGETGFCRAKGLWPRHPYQRGQIGQSGVIPVSLGTIPVGSVWEYRLEVWLGRPTLGPVQS